MLTHNAQLNSRSSRARLSVVASSQDHSAEKPQSSARAELSSPSWQVLHGDCLDRLKDLADSSVDAVVTDPPYGLFEKAPDLPAIIAAWLADKEYEHSAAGFMGASWDAFVPPPAVWREVMRVLKPGAFVLAFAGSRTYDLMCLSMRLAGLEIRDQILTWTYGTGMPKSQNVTKKIGKTVTKATGRKSAGRAAAKKHAGLGTGLKPAQEPIVVARKPLGRKKDENTVAKSVLKYGTGAINIDDCLIGKRWPANFAPSHTPECRHTGTRRVSTNGHWANTKVTGYGSGIGTGTSAYKGTGRRPKTETVEVWECVNGCPVRWLDEQTEVKPEPGSRKKGKAGASRYYLNPDVCPELLCEDLPIYAVEEGDAAPFRFQAKASKKERDAGLDGSERRVHKHKNYDRELNGYGPRLHGKDDRLNPHTTVKPIGLMEWLVKLVTPEGGVVLDPFCGSGTTGCAVVKQNAEQNRCWSFVGIEGDFEDAGYVEVARGRIRHWAQDMTPETPDNLVRGAEERRAA